MGRMLTSNSLTNLIRSFGRREQGLVQSLISDTRDPFYNLPTELVIYIFDFLHPYDVWSKRLICRRWNTVLSSENFTRTALNRFGTHDPEDSAISPENHASSSHMLALRHTLALQNGRPFSYVNYGDQFAFLPYSSPITHHLRLKGKHIAYLRGNPSTREGTNVMVRDLITGETTSLCGTAREKVMLIELSTDIVAFFTYTGTVYVASLLALPDSLRAVRLPSSKIHAAHADRGLLACLLGGTSGITVFVHDAEIRKSTSFSYQRHEYCDRNECDHGHAILINARNQCIDILSVVVSTDEPKLHVKVARYSLAGERKLQDRLIIWHGMEGVSRVTLGPILPAGEQGLFQLALGVHGKFEFHGTVLFDANFTPNTDTLKMIDEKMHGAVLWKDRLYRIEDGTSPFFVSTAQRPEPFNGPHSLRAMRNEARSRPMTQDEEVKATEEEYQRSKQEDADDSMGVVPMQGRPSSLRSWIRISQRGGRMHMTHGQDQPVILPAPGPPVSLEQAMLRPPFPPRLPAGSALHTLIAMNDTFAVATCFHSSYIGVVCFDERVKLHGAALTDLWAHANHTDLRKCSQDSDCKQTGPGSLSLE